MAIRPGSMLGQYEILSPLGKGGMGEVAIKVLPEEVARDGDLLERLEREARVLASLNHPHIVTLFSIEEAERTRFFTMELVEGRTLEDALAGAALAPDRFFEHGLSIVEAVAAAHRRGVTHRDLKPANVMVTSSGRVKVLDFGLAKSAVVATAASAGSEAPTAALTQMGTILGTVPYMSPEQLQGKPADPASDVFSLGILLYEMAVGRRPFRGESQVEVMSAILRDLPAPSIRSSPPACAASRAPSPGSTTRARPRSSAPRWRRRTTRSAPASPRSTCARRSAAPAKRCAPRPASSSRSRSVSTRATWWSPGAATRGARIRRRSGRLRRAQPAWRSWPFPGRSAPARRRGASSPAPSRSTTWGLPSWMAGAGRCAPSRSWRPAGTGRGSRRRARRDSPDSWDAPTRCGCSKPPSPGRARGAGSWWESRARPAPARAVPILQLFRDGIHAAGRWELAFAAVEACARVGEPAVAAALYPVLLEARRKGVVVRDCARGLVETLCGIAAASAGDHQAAEAHFAVALRQAEELPLATERAEARYWQAWSLLRRGGDGDRDRARALLGEAVSLYEEMRLRRHAGLARELLRASS